MSKARDLANSADVFDTVSTTELGYLDGVSSAIQTQIDGKQAVVSGVDSTEIGYLDGVTSAIQTQIDSKVASNLVDAKGDLLVGSADNTVSRLAVGTNNYVLTADSAEASGIKWAAASGGDTFAAGKNKIINGDFNINQRAFSTTTTNTTYGFDRWQLLATDGTTTYSAQTFTAGAAPVAGYEGTNFARLVSTGQTLASASSRIAQKIEDVRTFAGQTVTISFWAKASTGTPNIAVNLGQNFGTGGSTSVNGAGTKFAISSSWARYSATFSVASISGKTIGTNSFLLASLWISAGSDYNLHTDSLGIQSITVDFWGIQLEAGSVATAFQTATGTLAGELAACQRYFVKFGDTTQAYGVFGTGIAYSSTNVDGFINLPVEMRVKPTSITYSGCRAMDWTTYLNISSMTIDTPYTNTKMLVVNCVVTGATTKIPYTIGQNNQANDFISVSAEL